MENSFFVQYVLTTKMVTENPHLTFTKVYILRYVQIKKAKKKKENGRERGDLFIDNNILRTIFVTIKKNKTEYTNSASAKSFRYSEIIVSGRYEFSYSVKLFLIKLLKSFQC